MWQKRIKTWFNQPARKLRRHNARVAKAAKAFPKPIGLLRPVVHCCTSRYNANTREGRGFTKEELKGAKLNPVLARSIGIAIDYRRKNRSEESYKANVKRINAFVNKVKAVGTEKGQKIEAFVIAKKVKNAKAETITPEMRKFDAFIAARKAWKDKKCLGKRKVSAEKLAVRQAAAAKKAAKK